MAVVHENMRLTEIGCVEKKREPDGSGATVPVVLPFSCSGPMRAAGLGRKGPIPVHGRAGGRAKRKWESWWKGEGKKCEQWE
jgi:hypothetical protein